MPIFLKINVKRSYEDHLIFLVEFYNFYALIDAVHYNKKNIKLFMLKNQEFKRYCYL